MRYLTLPSPVGKLTVAATEYGIAALYFQQHTYGHSARERRAWEPDDGGSNLASRALADARDQLAAYFAGRLREFDLPLDPQGTPFQLRVWEALREIPYGETRSYGQIARRLGHAGASRAVGAANGRNPISIVVPCHRVIGANGSLTGYGGGMERKRWLLSLEAGNSALYG
jgi:methylated-DNA-[protein]-cysteine S-methyltransferase